MSALRFVLCFVLSVALALPAQATAFLSPVVKVHEPEDAFGLLLHRSGSSANAFLFCGEQYDADLGLYYLRARYLNTDSGRFWSMDEFEGDDRDAASLHKYLYASANPVTFIDPSGHASAWSTLQALAITHMLRISLAVPAVGVVLNAATRINVASVVAFYNRITVASAAAANRLPQLYAAARQLYPHLTKTHQHHVIPTYIADALAKAGQAIPANLQGIMIKIPHAYHQVVHNVIAKQFPTGDPLKYHRNLQSALKALEDIYATHPMP